MVEQAATEGVLWRRSGIFIINLKHMRPATLLKKRLWLRNFPVNFAKFLKTPFLQNISGRLLLMVEEHLIFKCHLENLKLKLNGTNCLLSKTRYYFKCLSLRLCIVPFFYSDLMYGCHIGDKNKVKLNC